jgi:hypothetical protein
MNVMMIMIIIMMMTFMMMMNDDYNDDDGSHDDDDDDDSDNDDRNYYQVLLFIYDCNPLFTLMYHHHLGCMALLWIIITECGSEEHIIRITIERSYLFTL